MIAVCLLLVSGALLAFPGLAEDPRSTEILEVFCRSELGRRDVTLFLNGTVRLREGPWEETAMHLDELGPERVAETLELLGTVYSDDDLDPLRQPIAEGAVGRWMERCEVRLALPGEEEFSYRFSSLDIPPLKVVRLVQIAEDLALFTRPLRGEEGLPKDYEPIHGDILRTAEGLLFKVKRKTADQRGLELEGVHQPMTVFVELDKLHEHFVALHEKSPWRPR